MTYLDWSFVCLLKSFIFLRNSFIINPLRNGKLLACDMHELFFGQWQPTSRWTSLLPYWVFTLEPPFFFYELGSWFKFNCFFALLFKMLQVH